MSVFIRYPDFQLVKNLIPLINKTVPVHVIGGKIRKPVSRLRTEQLRPVVDHAVTVFVQGKITASRRKPADLILLPVAVNIKKEGLVRKLCNVAIQIDHQRITHGGCLCPVNRLVILLIIRLKVAAHGKIQVKADLSSICAFYRTLGLERRILPLLIVGLPAERIILRALRIEIKGLAPPGIGGHVFHTDRIKEQIHQIV